MKPLYSKARESLLNCDSTNVFKTQEVREWQGHFELPSTVAEYYAELGPVDITIPGYGNPYFLPSLASLWQFQAGYRYHPQSLDHLDGWDDDWLVIADEGGDAFIYSRRNHTISFAYHGEGDWNPGLVFNSLEHMAVCLAMLGDICTTAKMAFTDEDSLIQPEHIQTASDRLTAILHDPAYTERVLTKLGWTRP